MNPIFSDLAKDFESTLNALYRERNSRRERGLRIIDLVSGNTNRAGLRFPQSILENALKHGIRQARTYRPDPMGQPQAREAIRAFYTPQGLDAPMEHILLTPGTSVSYEYLFKLLANPGDEILCPRPSYPLLDSIAELCGVRLIPYRLLEHKRWDIDLDHLNSRVSPKTRAIALISPHNPTGAVANETELAGLADIAARHRLPIILDEVFSTFSFTPDTPPRLPGKRLPLVFTLNGASKMFALPGLKISWMVVEGETALVKKAVHALDRISDTFLPVNEAAQFALPYLFTKGKPFMARYQREIRLLADMAMQHMKEVSGLSFIAPEGGFYLTLRIRSKENEETAALELLKDGIFVHPGYFYDLDGSHLVFSYVAPDRMLQTALKKIAQLFTQKHLSEV